MQNSPTGVSAAPPCSTSSLITAGLLHRLGGRPHKTPGGSDYWEFPVVVDDSRGETCLRIHEPCLGAWPTDLVDMTGKAVAIVNWPEREDQLRAMLRVLGCPVKCSLCQGIQDEGQCQACGRILPGLPIGG